MALSAGSQKVFVQIRDKFASSIHLVQTDETLHYTMNSDTIGRAIGVYWYKQRRRDRHSVYGVTSANTDVTPIFGCLAEVASDCVRVRQACNTRVWLRILLAYWQYSLLDLGKCALTANCIDRWVLQIQKNNLYIQHNSVADNLLLNTVSLNRAGLCERDTKELLKPNDGGRYAPKYWQLRGRKS
jgi:hypothetical protein